MNSEHNVSAPRATRLPVTKILLGAVAVSWINRQNLLKGLGATTLLIIAIKLGWHFIQASLGASATMVFLVLSMLFHAKFAVICHRLILVDFNSSGKLILPFSWSDRETRFFGWMLAVYFLVTIGSVLAMMVPFSLFAQSLPEATRNNPAQLFPYVVLFVGIPATYLLGRLSPIFPATALDRHQKLSWAWTVSKQNGLQLMVIVGLLPWISGSLNYFFVSNQPDVPTIILVNIINYIFITVEITALSLTYRELTQGEGSTAGPAGPSSD